MRQATPLVLCFATVLLAGLLVQPLWVQRAYVGGLGGGTVYNKTNITSGSGDGQVGGAFGPAGGFVLGQTMKNGRWGGEFRYIFFQNDIQLDGGAQSVDFGARSHSAAYDVLYYFNDDVDAKVRGYAAFGFGIKVFQGTGTEDPFQPGSHLALLTKTSQTVPAGDVGLGVRIQMGGNWFIRLEFRDYISAVPKNVIAESLNSEIGDIFHHWAPLFGIAWTF